MGPSPQRWSSSMKYAGIAVVLTLVLAGCGGGGSDNATTSSERSSRTPSSTTSMRPTTTRPAATTTEVELPQIALNKAPEMAEYLNTVAADAREQIVTCETDTGSAECSMVITFEALSTAQGAERAGGLLSNIEEVAPGAGAPVSSTRDYLDLVADQAAALRACTEPDACQRQGFKLIFTMAAADEEAALWTAL